MKGVICNVARSIPGKMGGKNLICLSVSSFLLSLVFLYFLSFFSFSLPSKMWIKFVFTCLACLKMKYPK